MFPSNSISGFHSFYRSSSTLSISLNRAINGRIRSSDLDGARQLFDQNPGTRNLVSWNSMIMAYFRKNQGRHAEELFDEMPHRDVVSWNTMLSGFRRANHPHRVHAFFRRMIGAGESPNELTFAVAISAFLRTELNVLVPQLHSRVLCSGVNLNVFVGSALMRGYTDLGSCRSLDRVFSEISSERDAAPWNVLILGYMEFGLVSKAQQAFDLMTPEKNSVTWSTLLNGYVKNKDLGTARRVFDKMGEKDVVTWTTMVKGYVQEGDLAAALDLFLLMLASHTRPNQFTFSSMLDACAGRSSLSTGIQVHAWVLKMGIPLDVVLSTSLVDMYAKCGDIGSAFRVFDAMEGKNLASWNSIIGGFAKHGLGTRAVEEFERMLESGTGPDGITFVNALSACVHGGMVVEGERIFKSMAGEHGVEAEMEHYACMVDMYGRAGELEKAEALIREVMPFEADVVVWGAFLEGCGLHSCPQGREVAARQIIKLERDHPAAHSALSSSTNVLPLGEKGENEAWRAKKQKAGSWVEL
ncbi:unnamed protein product [Cuscuta campestris]|uniref:Pentacotripeptide-repeat region of PRORP domain-containing protein n=1 Tax=Cuscuta campestris TaxID=132261 RepID=A0A484MAV7_9ASTE|nr:unnamed protein product [Cuscuta campestris]